MNPGLRCLVIPSVFLVIASVGLFALSTTSDARSVGHAESQSPPRASTPVPSIANRELSAHQRDLLEQAYQIASAIPIDPHVKTRSERMAFVVATCLQLGQGGSALRFLEPIPNWRRGAAFADLAYWCAENGNQAPVAECVERARAIAEAHTRDALQDWQRDRIRARIARVLAYVGEDLQAAALESNVAPSEGGHVAVVEARLRKPGILEEQVRALDAAAASGEFEAIRSAIEVCTTLFDAEYTVPERRDRVEARIRAAWTRVPLQVRVDALLAMGESAVDHDDRIKALALATEGREFLGTARVASESRVPAAARLAALRFLAGEAAEARRELAGARATFDAERARIIDVERASTLIPVAEAAWRMGDEVQAREIYTQAVEEAVTNPNSRPRATDLCSIACSLARLGIDPGASLWKRMRDAQSALGTPW